MPNALAGIVARDASNFADLICDLTADPGRRATLAQLGSDMVRQHYNEEQIDAEMKAAVGLRPLPALASNQLHSLLSA